MYPTAAECHKDACSSGEQMLSRVLRRWLAEPHGFIDENTSNYRKLCILLMFLVDSILDRSPDATLHEFWCDGVELVDWKIHEGSYSFGGACIYSDRQCNSMWLAPFRLELTYAESGDVPSAVRLRLGHKSQDGDRICKRYKCGHQYRLHDMAAELYESHPSDDDQWAAVVDIDPYVSE
ncbi:MAG: hypothetical protein K1X57_08530 [Gemmataceae bacterium]|nr:hypothetical protein [Gemmataceae bacterium]